LFYFIFPLLCLRCELLHLSTLSDFPPFTIFALNPYHLARDARSNVSFIDEYCSSYKDLFPEVRSYECFKYLHLGIISSISRKSLPEIAKVVGVNSPQVLHHFIAKSPWSAAQLRSRRLAKILEILQGQAITVVIDETGDRKKGNKTDYVARQYLGSVGKVDRGIVSVNAYGGQQKSDIAEK
jgi:SRSO17 transposase